ncbi:hypothetical protein HDV01_000354 [Terramyces sp. JEL0728]|nr:hypothetical protein HDV01_000354 [Terramyces sp. JEL0728]
MTTEADRDLAIKRIGDYLLKGWVLTDTPCRNCQIPTLRTKDSSTVEFCTVCQLASEEVVNNDIDDDLLKKKEMEYKKLLDLELNQPAPVAKKNVSELLGKHLLQGWTMMQECCDACEGVPYMRNKQKELFCVSCAKFKKPIAEIKSETVQLVEQSVSLPKHESLNMAIQTNSKPDPSRLMGKLLLQGWTMLENCCPSCNVPLMKKEMETYCVSCEQVTEDLGDLEFELSADKIDAKSLPVSESPAVEEHIFKKVKTAGILRQKIQVLGNTLSQTDRADEIIETCKAIEACASAINSLKNIE